MKCSQCDFTCRCLAEYSKHQEAVHNRLPTKCSKCR